VAERHIEIKATVQLITPDLAQVVAPRCKDQVLHEALGVIQGRRIARPQLLVELQQRAIDALGCVSGIRCACWVSLECSGDVGVVGVVVNLREKFQDLIIRAITDCAQQHGHRQLALAINLNRNDIAFGGLKLQPRTTVGDQLGVAQATVGSPIFLNGKINARRPNQLADNNALRAINNEGAVVGHQGEVTHEDVLRGYLTSLAVDEAGTNPQRRSIGHVSIPALGLGVLWLTEPEALRPGSRTKMQFQILVEADDRRDFLEQLLQTLRLEPAERVQLHLDQARQFVDVGNPRVRFAQGGKATISEMRHAAITPCTEKQNTKSPSDLVHLGH